MVATEAAGGLAMALDPAALFAAAVGEPDEWQREVLRSRDGNLLLNCCRQSGKSTVVACLAAHTAAYRPGSLVLLVSPSLRQSIELFKKTVMAARAAGGPDPARATLTTVEMVNDSRIVSLPGTEGTIRGYSAVDLILIDEAARVDDELYYSLRPMLATSGGRLVTLSTPFGRRGWWFSEWTDGGDGWRRYLVPAAECPRISPSFLEEERRSLGPLFFASEFECQFTDTTLSAFGSADIDRALDPSVRPLFAEAVA